MKFIAQVTSEGNASLENLQTFLRDTSEAGFLFTKKNKIKEFLKTLYEQGIDLEDRRPKEEHDKSADKMHDLLIWFREQSDECGRLFSKDLSV